MRFAVHRREFGSVFVWRGASGEAEKGFAGEIYWKWVVFRWRGGCDEAEEGFAERRMLFWAGMVLVRRMRGC